jgi:hypothetical protein
MIAYEVMSNMPPVVYAVSLTRIQHTSYHSHQAYCKSNTSFSAYSLPQRGGGVEAKGMGGSMVGWRQRGWVEVWWVEAKGMDRSMVGWGQRGWVEVCWGGGGGGGHLRTHKRTCTSTVTA